METLFQMFYLLYNNKYSRLTIALKVNFLMEICLSLTLAKLNFYLK